MPLSELIAATRPQPFSLRSPLSCEAALGRLSGPVMEAGNSPAHGTRGDPEWLVKGSTSFFWIRLYARRAGGPQNSLRPVFIGRLTAQPDGGCELAGTIGPDPAVRMLAMAILAIGAAAFIAGTLATILGLATGRPSSSVLASLAVVGISVVIIGFTTALSLVGTRLGQDAGAYLRRWLQAQLG